MVDLLTPAGTVHRLHDRSGGRTDDLVERYSVDAGSDRNAYLVGDAVGLATRDMCEGIGPAVRSSLLAAQSIVTGEPYSLAGISELSGDSFVSRLLERQFAGHQAGRML